MSEIINGSGYVYPNELHHYWSILIVVYPYITGLIAGAFIISSFYHVFGMKELKPIARFSLISALGFTFCVSLPLLFHLGHPERALNMLFTPHLTSAMSGFGIIYACYTVLLTLEVWLIYRPEIIRYANQTKGLIKLFYTVLALGVTNELSEKEKAIDKKVITFFAAIGIPAACLLHGYTGFIFGSVVANPWWSTPLMPFIFILSAMVSGIAMMILLYYITMRIIGVPVCLICFRQLAIILWAFLIVDATLELMEVIHIAYEGGESWAIISQLLSRDLSFTFYTLQLSICTLIPFLLLGFVVLFKPKCKTMNSLTLISSLLLIIQVASMRWNVIIGGQLFSKSFRGFTEHLHICMKEVLLEYYSPLGKLINYLHLDLFGIERIMVAASILTLCFVFIIVFCKLLPPFEKAEDAID
ncbi:MAG: NrfD/PsrC family molybdoenzyme membrane anchor subunit [Candidatus Desantisbacteria bacterium]